MNSCANLVYPAPPTLMSGKGWKMSSSAFTRYLVIPLNVGEADYTKTIPVAGWHRCKYILSENL